MKKGKFSNNKWRLPGKRQIAVIASIALLLVGMVGGTLAYLFTVTEDVENVFTPAEVPPTINEEFNGNVKKNVSVTNEGNVDAYIRAAVIVNWVDTGGNIVADPEGHEYSIVYTASGDWVKSEDGYYYYTKPVAAGDTTSELITSAKPTKGTVYKLQIDIAAQTIQSEGVNSQGKTPVELAWGEAAAKLVGAIK